MRWLAGCSFFDIKPLNKNLAVSADCLDVFPQAPFSASKHDRSPYWEAHQC